MELMIQKIGRVPRPPKVPDPRRRGSLIIELGRPNRKPGPHSGPTVAIAPNTFADGGELAKRISRTIFSQLNDAEMGNAGATLEAFDLSRPVLRSCHGT